MKTKYQLKWPACNPLHYVVSLCVPIFYQIYCRLREFLLSLLSFINIHFPCVNFIFSSFPLGLTSGGFLISFCPLGPVRRFFCDDAG